MRISDWSSDVCSSDLTDELRPDSPRQAGRHRAADPAPARPDERLYYPDDAGDRRGARRMRRRRCGAGGDLYRGGRARLLRGGGDRKSGVSGKSVSVRVDLGGRRIIKKKNLINYKCYPLI